MYNLLIYQLVIDNGVAQYLQDALEEGVKISNQKGASVQRRFSSLRKVIEALLYIRSRD
jgi:hypothetical protein